MAAQVTHMMHMPSLPETDDGTYTREDMCRYAAEVCTKWDRSVTDGELKRLWWFRAPYGLMDQGMFMEAARALLRRDFGPIPSNPTLDKE